MPQSPTTQLPALLHAHEQEVLNRWMSLQLKSTATRNDLMNEQELRQQSRDFLRAFAMAADDAGADVSGPRWAAVREMLESLSRSRAQQGFSPSETATFVFSLKEPIFALLRENISDVTALADQTWNLTTAIDALGLYTTETYQKGRQELIIRQQQEMLELSTPVVSLWQGILALPLIGTLDSVRTQIVMENLLQRIVDTGSRIAILDITGVPMVDTLVAQHLLKTVAAARLMGADCIISGIRPQIAQTIVHLGVDLNSVTTKATLADAFGVALKRLGLAVCPAAQKTNGVSSANPPVAAPKE